MPGPNAGHFSDDELLALLRDDSVSCETIAAEMEDAGAAPHPVPHLTVIRTILKSVSAEQLAAVEALPEPLRDFVIDCVQREAAGPKSAEAVALISAMASSKDKAVAKSGKKLLHGLKSRGMKVDAPASSAPVAPAVTAEIKEAIATAVMSSVDGAGRRLVAVAAAVRGGFDVAQLLISDEIGVVSADMLPLGRKEYKKFLDRLFDMKEMRVVETPRAYIRSLVGRALDLNARAGRAVPAGFNDVAFLLGPAVPHQPSLGRALARVEGESELAARGPELFKLREFNTWVPPETVGNALDAKLTQIESSQLYVDENQRAAAVHGAVQSAAEEFWRGPARGLYADRLFDMAYILSRTDRQEHAGIAAAVAWIFEAPFVEGSIVPPFAFTLFERFSKPPEDTPAPVKAKPAESLLVT